MESIIKIRRSILRDGESIRSVSRRTGLSRHTIRKYLGDALQFDWSEEHVVLGGVEQKIKVAHFRLCYSRKTFVVAYRCEPQEMVTYVSRSKDRLSVRDG